MSFRSVSPYGEFVLNRHTLALVFAMVADILGGLGRSAPSGEGATVQVALRAS